jgi:hypothetical protein
MSNANEPDLTEGLIFPWSDAEAAKVTDAIIKAIRKEPLDVVDSDYFEDGEIKRIKVAGRKYMQDELQAAGGNYLIETRWQEKPSNSELVEKLSSINAAAKRILNALGITRGSADVLAAITPQELRYKLQSEAALMGERVGGFRNHPPVEFCIDGCSHIDFRPASQLRDVAIGIVQLMEWASAAERKLKRRRKRTRSTRNMGDVARRRLLGDLMGIWGNCYAEVPKIGRLTKNGEPTGRFFLFAREVFRALNIKMASDKALGASIRDVLRGNPYQQRKRRTGG